ncbi:hypothetical protein TRVL_00184 [Trypanosoma vivax]|nr:hypothetical protein TRVL_00184 [Trypanosoma vivax]
MIDPFCASLGSSVTHNGGNSDHHHSMQRSSSAVPPNTDGPVHSGGIEGSTTFHITATTEVDPCEEKQLEHIRRTLMLLGGISQGLHIVNWNSLVDPSKPVESAKSISAVLAKPTTLPSAIESVAKCMTTPAHLSIVANLEPPFWSQVRDAVLHDLLNTLTTERESHPMPLCSEMLAEMVRLNLVVLRGVSKTLEALLNDPGTRRAAIAVLGKLADHRRGDEVFALAVQNLEPLLHSINEPEYDYDRIAISRLLRWCGAENDARLVRVKNIFLQQQCPVTCMAYFTPRDELASATCDGTVIVWGGPHPSTGEVRPSVMLELPQNHLPVAMDSPSRGNYLAVAVVPIPAANMQAMMKEYGISTSSHGGGKKKQSLSSIAKGPYLRFLTCNESTGVWSHGESISRKENSTITTVAALSNHVVCVAESCISERPSESGTQHDLVLINGYTGQTMGHFECAHSDHITVLRTAEDNDHMLYTGSRDHVVKVWDARISGSRGAFSTGVIPTQKVENSHTGAITAILPHRKALLTASLDGNLLVWDARHLTVPVRESRFMAPILDVKSVDGSHVVVSTARGLNLLSLETMKILDIVPNVAYTQLKANYNGKVVFAAGGSGVSVYALRRQ